jgi:hypothetical protein
MTSITIDQTIARGTRLVNVPVFVILFAPGIIWLWWSVQVPKWRLWAYERVDDIGELKRRAIEARLIWPDGSVFSRTEIKSAAQAARERELEQRASKLSVT